mgnify:CR=1 FL=1
MQSINSYLVVIWNLLCWLWHWLCNSLGLTNDAVITVLIACLVAFWIVARSIKHQIIHWDEMERTAFRIDEEYDLLLSEHPETEVEKITQEDLEHELEKS